MKYAIIGARSRTDRQTVEDFVTSLFQNDIVISGGAAGPDTWAIEAARRRGLQTREFLPDLSNCQQRWQYTQAYYDRNQQIAKACDVLVAFVALNRKGGTENTIQYAQKLNKPIIIIP